MQERKNKKNQNEKDYYFPVILSQILCCAVITGFFFFARGTSARQQLSEKYASLLQEDFLTVEFSGVVSSIKEYLMHGSASFAVNSNRVEQYTEADSNMKQENTSELQDDEALSAEESTSLAVQTMSSGISSQTVPLKLEYNNKEDMLAPVNGGVYTSYFGERTDPIAGDDDYHKGIDIAADEGTAINAAFDGVVSYVGEDELSGKYVFLDHGKGIVTLYCHCSEILVSEGDIVSRGDIVAFVGSTGYSTGPHLHFEIRMNGESVDPLPLLENAV